MGQKWARNAAAPLMENLLLFRSGDHHIALGQWESVKTTLHDPGGHIVWSSEGESLGDPCYEVGESQLTDSQNISCVGYIALPTGLRSHVT